jgi:serine/threonine protein kinase
MATVPRVGTELAGYRIEELIDRGGMSVVYLAEHIRLGRSVALKILSAELAEDDRFRQRFLRESRIAASMNHSNIVPIFDAGEAEGNLFIAMQYLPKTLDGLLKESAPLDVERALSIVGQIAAALDAAHTHGLIHRDVKPANVLISPGEGGEQDRAYLSDFGLTKRTESQAGSSFTGQFAGTIDFVAPEQIEGQGVDWRADVYSLGCVLYQCLTGVPPFERDNEVAVLYAHLREPAPLLTGRRPDLSPALNDVIAKSMAKAPTERYATCRELVTDARQKLSSAPVQAPPAREDTPPAETTTPHVKEPRRESRAERRERDSVGRKARRPFLLALLVLAAVALAFVAGGEFHHSSSPSLMTVRALLLDHIPPGVRFGGDTLSRQCRPAMAPGDAFVRDASESCSVKDRGITVQYTYAHSGDMMVNYYKSRLKALGITARKGDCSVWSQSSNAASAEGMWFRGGLKEHSTRAPDKMVGSSGSVFCYSRGGRQYIEWMDSDLEIYASASITGTDRKTLLDFWQSIAGPEDPQKLPGSNGSM